MRCTKSPSLLVFLFIIWSRLKCQRIILNLKLCKNRPWIAFEIKWTWNYQKNEYRYIEGRRVATPASFRDSYSKLHLFNLLRVSLEHSLVLSHLKISVLFMMFHSLRCCQVFFAFKNVFRIFHLCLHLKTSSLQNTTLPLWIQHLLPHLKTSNLNI